jgi:hypothetical protein
VDRGRVGAPAVAQRLRELAALLVDDAGFEVADPVEDNSLAYERPSASGLPVKISDFVTENWFRPHSAGPYDFMRHTSRPLQVLDGGYQMVWVNGAWDDAGVSSRPLERV